MGREKLDRNHIGLQFLMMLLSLLGFLVLTFFSGEIIWMRDFQYFVVFVSGILAIFIGILALLRYYTQKQSLTYLFLGIGFLVVGFLDIIQLVIDITEFRNLFIYSPGEVYPFTSILSRSFLSLLLFLGWLLSRNKDVSISTKKNERKILLIVVSVFVLFGGVILYLVLSNVIVETLWVIILGLITLLLLVLSLVGYLFRREWEYNNFEFWLIFSVSFLLLSQVFFLPLLNIEYYNMVNLSIWAKFFGYVTLLTGFLNSIYEMYQKELEVQKELEFKNKLLDETKKKVEEAYLVVRKEKWDMVKGKKGLKSVGKKK